MDLDVSNQKTNWVTKKIWKCTIDDMLMEFGRPPKQPGLYVAFFVLPKLGFLGSDELTQKANAVHWLTLYRKLASPNFEGSFFEPKISKKIRIKYTLTAKHQIETLDLPPTELLTAYSILSNNPMFYLPLYVGIAKHQSLEERINQHIWAIDQDYNNNEGAFESDEGFGYRVRKLGIHKEYLRFGWVASPSQNIRSIESAILQVLKPRLARR